MATSQPWSGYGSSRCRMAVITLRTTSAGVCAAAAAAAAAAARPPRFTHERRARRATRSGATVS